MPGVFCVLHASNHGLMCRLFAPVRTGCSGGFTHLSNKKSQINLLQRLRKGFPIICTRDSQINGAKLLLGDPALHTRNRAAKTSAGGQRYERQIQRCRQDALHTSGRAGATREKENGKKERAHAGAKHQRPCCGVALAQAGMPVLLEGKEPARRRRYEAHMCKQVRKKRRRYRGGCYVYDSGGAELSCGLGRSDYDVRSSRCTLACPGCVLEAG
jgi:hypothetical protein